MPQELRFPCRQGGGHSPRCRGGREEGCGGLREGVGGPESSEGFS